MSTDHLFVQCEGGFGRLTTMLQYLKYVSFGLILMAPQELIVAIFKEKAFTLYLMALAFWAVMLSAMYGLFRVTKRFIKREALEVTLSAVFYMMVAFCIEWGIIGNSPWANPGANQLGLVAGWVSVFILPRVFLEDKFESIRTWTKIWYVPFVLSLFLPVLLLSEKGRIVGIWVYGYTVIPFLFLSVWYGCAKWRPIQRDAQAENAADKKYLRRFLQVILALVVHCSGDEMRCSEIAVLGLTSHPRYRRKGGQEPFPERAGVAEVAFGCFAHVAGHRVVPCNGPSARGQSC